jgi:hypothetical protein
VIFREPAAAWYVHDSTGAVRTQREFLDSFTVAAEDAGDPERVYRLLFQLTAYGTADHPSDEHMAKITAGDAARPPELRVSPRAFLLFGIAQCNGFQLEHFAPGSAAAEDYDRVMGRKFPLPAEPVANRNVGSLYYTTCLMNSSCEPSVTIRVDWDPVAAHGPVVTATAAVDIPEGGELTNCYSDPGLPLEARQRKFKSIYKFVCKCPKCRRELLASMPGLAAAGAGGAGGGGGAAAGPGSSDGR